MSEFERREAQEHFLYEVCLVQSILTSGKIEELRRYLAMSFEKGKNGMTEAQIDAVRMRALNAAEQITG